MGEQGPGSRAARRGPRLVTELAAVRTELTRFEARFRRFLRTMTASTAASGRNLLHYLALRQHDLRRLQGALAEHGLSSLGRAEAHVQASLDAVLHAAERLGGAGAATRRPALNAACRSGAARLRRNAALLLGRSAPRRAVSIMVTMPSEAANDYPLVRRLLEAGMNCARINCAHDDAAVWGRMIAQLRRAERATGRRCRLLMDLGGPKLRTGPVIPAPAVVKLRPDGDAYGRVLSGFRVWLSPAEASRAAATPAAAELTLPRSFLAPARRGDVIALRDARGARRELQILESSARGSWASGERTTYLTPGLQLRLRRRGRAIAGTRLARVPDRPGAIELRGGDLLELRSSLEAGRPATRDARGAVLTPAWIGCTMPQIFAGVRVGEPVWFDDGKIGGLIRRVEADLVRIVITHTPPGGARLRADKGINLPESDLRIAALTNKDRADLAFVARHADMVALSFASAAADVRALHRELDAHGAPRLPVVLKIETQRGFRSLPAMLLTALSRGPCGVMIARGDLAIECGYERLAEVQEEILWMSEAAHVPVIWATQVLESLAKTGLPSRAEITDAAMSNRAECVMLNKGPHIAEAVELLANIVERMAAHQQKKRSMLRALRLARLEPGQLL
jgi:pyruvate kinase